MTEIIGVRFKNGGKQYYFNPNGISVQLGQGVILETSRGTEYGECVRENSLVEEHMVVHPLRPLIRIATEKDYEILKLNQEKEEKAFALCVEKIQDHGLEMKLVEVECTFDGNKILFYFTSEGRVDFRNLVKDLAYVFHTRIELRQIGVRDEAKLLGGLGICGRPFCCSQFLEDFQPVSIKMAKTQGLSLNPVKISGTCGRLMCCLKYEQDAYEDAMRRCPKYDSFVETPDGVGNVTHVNLLREKVKVRLEDTSDPDKVYHNQEVRVIRSGKGRRPDDYIKPSSDELEKLRVASDPLTLSNTGKSTLVASLEEMLSPEASKRVEEHRTNRTQTNKHTNKSSKENIQDEDYLDYPQVKGNRNAKHKSNKSKPNKLNKPNKSNQKPNKPPKPDLEGTKKTNRRRQSSGRKPNNG